MRALVTGATGFLGTVLAESLVEGGHSVAVLARETGDASRLASLDVEIFRGDIRDIEAVRAAVRGRDHVYHLAAATSWRKPARGDYWKVNVEGTANVARASLEAGAKRLVYASSVGVYGLCRGFVDEGTDPDPDSTYRASKLAGEKAALGWHAKGLSVVVARLSTIHGRGSSRWLGLCRSLTAGRVRLVGHCENHVHDVHVSDAAAGLRACAETEQASGRRYILAGPAPVSVGRLVDLLALELDVDPPSRHLPAAPFFAFYHLCAAAYRRFGLELSFSRKFDLFLSDRKFSTSRARTELGYAPQTSMEAGVRDALEWYRAGGYL